MIWDCTENEVHELADENTGRRNSESLCAVTHEFSVFGFELEWNVLQTVVLSGFCRLGDFSMELFLIAFR